MFKIFRRESNVNKESLKISLKETNAFFHFFGLYQKIVPKLLLSLLVHLQGCLKVGTNLKIKMIFF